MPRRSARLLVGNKDRHRSSTTPSTRHGELVGWPVESVVFVDEFAPFLSALDLCQPMGVG